MIISAIGTAHPKQGQDQLNLIETLKKQLKISAAEYRFLNKVYRATGIETRYSVVENINFYVNSDSGTGTSGSAISGRDSPPFPSTKQRMTLYKKHALSLAEEAIEDCLKNLSGFKLENITHIITVSCTGMYAPGLDVEIIEKLKLSSQIHRTCINFMGCYGVFSALKMARSICQASKKAKVLIVSVELCSLHLQQKTSFKDNIVASAIFGDGAAAALVESEPSSHSYLALQDFYCELISEGKQEMAWEIGDFGFEINLTAFVPKLIERGIKTFMEKALDQLGLTLADIQYYAIHPGSKKILETCDRALNIAKNQSLCSYEILKNYGNMSSATILFVLKKLYSDLKAKKAVANIFSCGFGPGLTMESMILKYHYDPIH